MGVGGSPTASYFILRGQNKVTKQKATLLTAPTGFPALLAKPGGCGTRPTASDSPRRLPPARLRYSAAEKGNFKNKKQRQNRTPCPGKARTGQDKTNTRNARDSTFFEISPAAPLRLSRSGGRYRRALFELRSSLRFVQAARASCAAPSERFRRRYPEGAAQWGGLLLGYLFLATQEKVTSRRATPGKPCSSDTRRIGAPIR